jgi:hypothetical protein
MSKQGVMGPPKQAAKRVAIGTSGTEEPLAKQQKVLLRPEPFEGTETVEKIETYVSEPVPYVEERDVDIGVAQDGSLRPHYYSIA